jgi:hypothetical protein
MIANAYAGPQQELVPLVRRGDVVRFVRAGSFLPRRGATRWCYVKVSSDIQRRAQYGRGPEWVSFVGAPVRCYGDHAAIGPEQLWDVQVAALHRLPRRPLAEVTP